MMTSLSKAREFFAYLDKKIDDFNKGVKSMGNFGFIKDNADTYDLFGTDGVFVQSYARRRDAVRGANRKGIALAQ